jgi:hypothetical protein
MSFGTLYMQPASDTAAHGKISYPSEQITFIESITGDNIALPFLKPRRSF